MLLTQMREYINSITKDMVTVPSTKPESPLHKSPRRESHRRESHRRESPLKPTSSGVRKPSISPKRVQVSAPPMTSASPSRPVDRKKRPSRTKRALDRLMLPFMSSSERTRVRYERMERWNEKQQKRKEEARRKEQLKAEKEAAERARAEENREENGENGEENGENGEESGENGDEGAIRGGNRGRRRTRAEAEEIVQHVRSEMSISSRHPSADNRRLEAAKAKIQRKSKEKARQRKGAIGKTSK